MLRISMSSVPSGLNPPFPAPVEDEDASSTQKHPAQRLLTLIRLVGKEDDPETYESLMSETVDLMNSLIETYSRRGLLQGTASKAERILSSTSSQGKKTQGKKGHGKSGKIQMDSQENESRGSDLSQVPETLIFTAMTRILTESNNSPRQSNPDTSLLLALTAELIMSISQYILPRRSSGDQCSLAEYELLSLSGKAFLSAFVSNIQILDQSTNSKNRFIPATRNPNEDIHVVPVLSLLRASTSLINLFGTKLSRSTALLQDLRTVAWKFLASYNSSVQEASARLLSAMALAGGVDRKTPTDLLNLTISDVLAMLNKIVDSVAPVSKPSTGLEWNMSVESSSVFEEWMAFLQRHLSGEEERVAMFQVLLNGLALVFRSSLRRDNVMPGSGIAAEVHINIDMVLEVVERFLSYPISAESLHFRTKRRLRDEAMEGGIVSSRVIASKAANSLKRLGHDILDDLLVSIGGPVLQPYARRIIRMSYASLLTSCSGAVRKVVDPASAVQLEGKKRRWLYLSTVLRTRTVETIRLNVLAFGSDRTSKQESSGRQSKSKSDGEMAITLVAATLLEQLRSSDSKFDVEEAWGTEDERVAIIKACLDCLRCSLVSCEGFLGTETRSVIDSIVVTCLARNDLVAPGSPFSCTRVQSNLLRLATTCVTTPWHDGAATSISISLKRMATRLSNEQDTRVSLSAKEAIRVCDMSANPRAAPLVFVHRTHETLDHLESVAPNMMENIDEAKAESKESRSNAAQAAKSKAQQKRQRDAEKEEAIKRKKENVKNTKDAPVSAQRPEDSSVQVDDVVGVDANAHSKETVAENKAIHDTKIESLPEKNVAPPAPSPTNEEVEVDDSENQESDNSDDADIPDIDIVDDGPDSDDD